MTVSQYLQLPASQKYALLKLTTECLTCTRIPFIEDKDIAIAESLAADPDDNYDMPKYCDVDQKTEWTGFRCHNNTTLPTTQLTPPTYYQLPPLRTDTS